MAKRSEKRRRNHRLVGVRFNEEEAKRVEDHAEATGLSVAGLMRKRALDYQPKSIIDHVKIHQLALLRGDLGRLGGLIKLALSTEAMTWENKMEIEALLGQVRSRQKEVGVLIEDLHREYQRRQR